MATGLQCEGLKYPTVEYLCSGAMHVSESLIASPVHLFPRLLDKYDKNTIYAPSHLRIDNLSHCSEGLCNKSIILFSDVAVP